MPLLLPAILKPPPRQHAPLLLLQSSIAQSILPLLRGTISHLVLQCQIILVCALYPPSSLIDKTSSQPGILEIFDLLNNVPGYNEEDVDWREEILSCVKSVPNGRQLHVIIDSAETIASNMQGNADAYKFLRDVFEIIRKRQDSSRLVVHVVNPSPLIPLLTQISFSGSLTYLIAHPPVLLTHLATEYLMPPPPASVDAKFWGVFLPVSERVYESERLVFGSGGEGWGGCNGEIVVEVLVRGGDDASRKRKPIQRVLEGWSTAVGGACDLSMLESLKGVWGRTTSVQLRQDPVHSATFNLSLTPAQLESRSQVPLPYAHEGKPLVKQDSEAAIFYDPDSADDIDDDDPDEDLDI